MFVIRVGEQYFCKKHTDIIVFETFEDANLFANHCFQYMTARMAQEDMIRVIEVMQAQSMAVIEEVDIEDWDKDNISYIMFADLKK